MSQMILGLDLGATAVRAVLLESTYRGFAVAGRSQVRVAAGGPDAPPLLARQAAAVEALLAAEGWRPDDVLVAVPGAGMAASLVSLPFTDQRRIEQTIAFEVEGQLPFELDTVAWDWQPLAPARAERSDLLVGVARKEELAALLAALQPAGLDPRMVIPPAPAYAALVALGGLDATRPAAEEGAPPEAGTALVIDMGAERTSLCFASAAGCEAARSFAFGAGALARSLVRALGITEAEAQLALSAEAQGEPLPEPLAERLGDPRAGAALQAGLAPLVRELRATLRAWRARSGGKLARVHLAGALAGLPGLPELLAPEVDAPVAPLALGPLPGVALPPEETPALALALSLALRGHQGARGPRLNLRRGALAFTRDFEHLKGRVVRLAVFGGLILVLAVVSAGVKLFALSHQEALLDRALCDAETSILGKCYDDPAQAEAELRGRGTLGASLPKATAVDLLADSSQRVPVDVKVRFDRIDITREKLHLEGTTADAASVDRIVSGLQASRCFKDARSGASHKRPDGRFEFSVDAGLSCLETGVDGGAGGRG
ncbi:MAG: pilus assembly protein PilM [Anaeromyxobacter sp.]